MQLKNPAFGFLLLVLCAFHYQRLSAQTTESEQLVESPDAALLTAKGETGFVPVTDEDLERRLAEIPGCLEMRATDVVKSYINTYVRIKPDKAKIMLGRRLTFFPLFEEKLQAEGIPKDLKYLAVVESALNPKAVSKVGATGLWQFMPATGSEYGLHTNSAVEDRSNPVKSTEAAVRYLRDLYGQFNDWALALAAYNSGPTRVNSAIKKAGSRNFWDIMRFLPKETRNYVPAFIAASYICNFYQVHEINPTIPDLDEQITGYINIFDGLSFRSISDATGIDVDVIRNLNPGFKRDYVPPSTDGNYVLLPKRVMPAFIRYLNSISDRAYAIDNNETYINSTMGDGRYWKSTTNAGKQETLDQIAQRHGLIADHLKTWNGLSSTYLNPGQEISIWNPVFVQRHSEIKIEAPAQAKTQRVANKAKKSETIDNALEKNTGVVPSLQSDPYQPKQAEFQFHTVKRNESLEDIARQYATSVESLRKLNGTDQIRFGMRLKIRQY
ncbi:MAG: transglycosylase SLT domain-containing protein [Bacteroidetes bacterium]|nr:transglycosylase SLT domain-containing protein [Bacteroidota bacterium]